MRGAPNIGIAAAYGLAMEIARRAGDDDAAQRGRDVLRDARPTAVNLAWAVDRVQAAALAARAGERAAAARAEAETIHAGEDAASAAIALLGADLLAGARRILTHCNTGALACGGHRLGARGRDRARRSATTSPCSPARRARCCRARG